MYRKGIACAAVAAVLVVLAGCELVGEHEEHIDYDRIDEIRFSRHVQPLLDRTCTSCHGEDEAAAGLRLDTWEHLIEGSRFGEAVIPFDAGRSLLVELTTALRGGPHPHELGADTLTRAEVDFLARWIEEGARNDAGEVPYAGAEQLLYVTNQGSAVVSIIDMTSNLVIRTVDLQEHGFSANAKPHHVAIEPDGSYWYVSLIGDGRVARFDRENRLVATASMETPGMLAVHPTRDLLLAGRSMTAVNPPAALGFIRRSDMQVEEVPVVFPRPHALGLSATGAYAYTASLVENQVVTVDVERGDVAFTAVAGPPQSLAHMAVAPDGRTMYLTAHLTGEMHVFDISSPATPVHVGAVGLGSMPWHPVVTPDSRTVYVGNKGSNTVSVVDAATRAVVDLIEGEGLAEPNGSAVSPDGRYVYVTNNNLQGTYRPRYDLGGATGGGGGHDHGGGGGETPGTGGPIGTVVVIETATNRIVRVIEVEENPTGIERRP